MKAEIIAIGTELLLGHIVNTNAAYISERLAEMGIDLYRHTTVGDNPSRLTAAMAEALERADIVITTGGLGPTVDDVTAESLAKFLERRLVLNRQIINNLKSYFTKRKIRMPKDNIRQAYIPEGAGWLRNEVGTAPGLVAEFKGKLIICLPGPPREVRPMFEKKVVPILIKRGLRKDRCVIMSRSIKMTGLAEAEVNTKAKELLKLKPPTTVGIYAKLGEVELRIMSKARSGKEARKTIARIEKIIRRRFKNHVFGCDDDRLEDAVAGRLFEKGKTVAVAESCTGGLVSHRLTNVNGSSKYFLASVVAYSNPSKVYILGVPAAEIERFGAVSAEVALEMARGVRLLCGSDIGIGITGIAGPTGGTAEKRVGLVYIAAVTDRKRPVKEFRFRGSREEIKFQASQAALDIIRKSF